jgi:hypothetical protein
MSAFAQRYSLRRCAGKNPASAQPPAPHYGRPQAGAPAYSSVRIIGIARDAVNGWVGDGTDRTCVFLPTTAQAPGNVLFARVHGPPEVVRRRLDSTLSSFLPGAVAQIHTMDEILDVQRYPFRASYWVSGDRRTGPAADTLWCLRRTRTWLHSAPKRSESVWRWRLHRQRRWTCAGRSLKFSAAGRRSGTGRTGRVPHTGLAKTLFLFDSFDARHSNGGNNGNIASACAGPIRRAAPRIEPLTTLRYD